MALAGKPRYVYYLEVTANKLPFHDVPIAMSSWALLLCSVCFIKQSGIVSVDSLFQTAGRKTLKEFILLCGPTLTMFKLSPFIF